MDRLIEIARVLADARIRLAAADLRKRFRQAKQMKPELRPLIDQCTGKTFNDLRIVSFLYDRVSESVVFELDTNREGMYVLLSTDLAAEAREDGSGLEYTMARAQANIYNEQNVHKRTADLSPDAAKVYKSITDFETTYLRPWMRKLSAALQGFMREPEGEEQEGEAK
jgi:hypothetical protein